MGTVTKPMLLDETGQRIATALETIAENGGGSGGGSGTPIYRHYIYFEDYLDENKGYNFVFYTDSSVPIQTFEGIYAIANALCDEHHWIQIYDENGNVQLITGVDGATTITSNLHDWTASGIENINDKVTLVGNGGGNSETPASGSPYVISYFDVLEIVKNKSIDVATLISILEEKISNFATLEVDGQYSFTTTEQVFTSWSVSFITLVKDSDNNVEIYANGDYVVTESTTVNIKQILTLNASDIENVTFSTFTNLERDYIGSVYFGKYGNETPITVEELKTIFK